MPALVLLLALPSQAATLSVPSQHATIQGAVDASVSGDTIVIGAGTYVEDVVTGGKSLTLQGAGPELTTLVAYGTTAAISSSGGDLTVEGMTIDGELAARGIEVLGVDDVVIRDVHILDAASGEEGGAIRILVADSLLVEDVVVSGASASEDGGGIWVTSVNPVQVRRSIFCGGSSVGSGSAIYTTLSSGVLENNIFVDNLSSSAVYLDDGHWTAAHNLFLHNQGTSLEQVLGTLTATHNLFHEVDFYHLDIAGTTLVEQYNVFGDSGLQPIDAGSPDATSLTGYTPAFRGYPPNRCVFDDFLPELDEPYLDLGGRTADLDGSDAAAGPSGGPEAPPSWFESHDGDPSPWIYDCDDDDGTNWPGNVETCAFPGDNDCDGLADDDEIYTYDGVADVSYWHEDVDGDGYGSEAAGTYTISCDNPDAGVYVANGLDCDDGNPYRHPGVDEVCADGIDNNCDYLTDDPTAVDAQEWYTDEDGDGYGPWGEVPVRACTDPGDDPYGNPRTTVYGDCVPTDPAIHEGAVEVCDGIDNDCVNGEYFATDAPTWVPDSDGDGYRAPSPDAELVVCDAPGPEYIDADDSLGDDCNDAEATVYPGAEEVCDGLDNDCNNLADDLPGTPVTVYLDQDGDGAGADDSDRLTHCPNDDEVSVDGDCDDLDPNRAPGLTEACDGIDNDCDGGVDNGPMTTWYEDFDSDGYGEEERTQMSMCAPEGYVDNADDCHDALPDVNPEGTEVAGNDIDEDCDGIAQGSGGDTEGVTPNKGAQGCQCSQPGSGPVVLWWALPLLGLVRRRV